MFTLSLGLDIVLPQQPNACLFGDDGSVPFGVEGKSIVLFSG